MANDDLRRERRRRWLRAGVIAALLVAIGAHVFWWYWPRPVSGLPAADSVAATLLSAEGFDVAAWIPYPHQNLGALAGTVGDREAYLAALGRLADVKPPRIPRFGPFPVPPSTELGIAVSFDERRTLVVARVFPVIAFLARWAGRLADNPFLSGGAVDLGGEGALVRWVGNDWHLATTGASLQDGGVPVPPAEVLALIRVSTESEVLPRGLYRLERHDRDLVLRSGQSDVGEDWSRRAVEAEPAFVAMRTRHPNAAVLSLLDGESADGWPPAVTYELGREKRFRLPGEALVDFAGGRALVERDGPWTIRAFDQETLKTGVGLLESTKLLVAFAHQASITRGLVADVRATRRLATRFVEKTRELPVVGEQLDTYWQDIELVLEPLWAFRRLSVSLAENPPVVEVRLWAVEETPSD